jgi:hypothetical protein
MPVVLPIPSPTVLTARYLICGSLYGTVLVCVVFGLGEEGGRELAIGSYKFLKFKTTTTKKKGAACHIVLERGGGGNTKMVFMVTCVGSSKNLFRAFFVCLFVFVNESTKLVPQEESLYREERGVIAPFGMQFFPVFLGRMRNIQCSADENKKSIGTS